MMSLAGWAPLATVVAALIAAAGALVGIVVKNRWDTRTAARTDQTRWIRERRERVYVDFLVAIARHAVNLPHNPSVDLLRYPEQTITPLEVMRVWYGPQARRVEYGPIRDEPVIHRTAWQPWEPPPESRMDERGAWQEVAKTVSAIRPYGSAEVLQAATHLFNLLDELRNQLDADAAITTAGPLSTSDANDEKLKSLARKIKHQRVLVNELIRKELSIDS